MKVNMRWAADCSCGSSTAAAGEEERGLRWCLGRAENMGSSIRGQREGVGGCCQEWEGCTERQPWPKVGGVSCFGVNFSRLFLCGLFLSLRGNCSLRRGAQSVRNLGRERTEGKDWGACVLGLWVQAVCCPWKLRSSPTWAKSLAL